MITERVYQYCKDLRRELRLCRSDLRLLSALTSGRHVDDLAKEYSISYPAAQSICQYAARLQDALDDDPERMYGSRVWRAVLIAGANTGDLHSGTFGTQPLMNVPTLEYIREYFDVMGLSEKDMKILEQCTNTTSSRAEIGAQYGMGASDMDVLLSRVNVNVVLHKSFGVDKLSKLSIGTIRRLIESGFSTEMGLCIHLAHGGKISEIYGLTDRQVKELEEYL